MDRLDLLAGAGGGPASRSLNPLLLGGMAAATATAYTRAVAAFRGWLLANCPSFATHGTIGAAALDGWLAAYLLYLHEAECGKGFANCTVYGLKAFYPQLGGRLPVALRCLKGFNKLRPSTQHPPISHELAIIVACWLAVKRGLTFGVAALLAFDCFLRVGELCAIKLDHIALPGDSRISTLRSTVTIRLPRTKTGVNQSVELFDPDVAVLVRLVAARRREAGCRRLFPFKDEEFRSALAEACATLGLHPFTPHSFRHGGASHFHFILKWRAEDVMARGRWLSIESFRRYLQSSHASALSTTVPPAVQRAAALVDGLLLHLLHGLGALAANERDVEE